MLLCHARQRLLVNLCFFLLLGIAVARIVSTYNIFNQTFDEPAHLATGMEWLDKGTYTYEQEHPPVARIAIAFGPFRSGLRSMGGKDIWIEGNQILYARDQYTHTLTLARLGVLPFFVIAALSVWAWAQMQHGRLAALFAVLLFTTLPPVLAHAGLATTDMAVTEMSAAALLAFVAWLDRPTLLRTVLVGFTVALAILSKFSALLFLPACGLPLIAWRWLESRKLPKPPNSWRGRRVMASTLALLVGFFVIWGGYRFSIRPFATPADRPHKTIDRFFGAKGAMHDRAYSVAERIAIPAPEFFQGLNKMRHFSSIGHTSYLLGEVRDTGWWYFFPVALGVKSPLPFLILTIVGFVVLAQQARTRKEQSWRSLAPAISALFLLLVCLPSRIQLGIRHVLPIYPLLAIVAGSGAAGLWQLAHRKWASRMTVVALLVWQLVSSAYVHPDYLAYFNELAGQHPERILVDSDLDWGQDLLRLSEALRARGIDEVSLAYWGHTDIHRHGLPPVRQLVPHQRTAGWIAIGETCMKEGEICLNKGGRDYAAFSWLEDYKPVATIGRSMKLYYIPRAPVSETLSGKAPKPTAE